MEYRAGFLFHCWKHHLYRNRLGSKQINMRKDLLPLNLFSFINRKNRKIPHCVKTESVIFILICQSSTFCFTPIEASSSETSTDIKVCLHTQNIITLEVPVDIFFLLTVKKLKHVFYFNKSLMNCKLFYCHKLRENESVEMQSESYSPTCIRLYLGSYLYLLMFYKQF